MKIKGFAHTGNGPKTGHSFGGGHGFTGSTGRTQHVKSYTRTTPTPASPQFKQKTAPQKGGNTLVQRSHPVTQADKTAGGKSPLRAGFAKGGQVKPKDCYADGGKVNAVGAAIRMTKELMRQGNTPEQAAKKASTRYGVPSDKVAAPAPGDPKTPMLAGGGMVGAAAPMSRAMGQATPARTYGAFRNRPLIR